MRHHQHRFTPRALAAALACAALGAQAAPFLYVPSSTAGYVQVYDAPTRQLVTTIPAGTNPFPLAVSPDGTRVVVGNQTSNNITIIETTGNTVVATLPAGTNPYGVAIGADSTRAYVAHYASNDVRVIDLTNNTVLTTIGVGRNSSGIAVNPQGTRVYVTNGGASSVSVIDTATNTVVATIADVGTSPWGIVFSPDGARAYVANYSGANVSVIDTATNTVAARWPVQTQPIGVAVSGDGSRIYVANAGSNTLSIVDTTAGFLLNNLPVGARPYGVAADPGGRLMYVTNAGSFTEQASVSVVDGMANVVLATMPGVTYAGTVGQFVTPYTPPGVPTGLAAAPGNAKATVSFIAPFSDGGLPITGYTVQCGAQTRIGTASPIVVDQLANGVATTCRIRATNERGHGAWSGTVGVTPGGAPAAPSIASVAAGDASVSVAFAAPGDDGGLAISGYTAQCGSGSTTGAASPLVVSGLANGTPVTCTVTARNALGDGAASPPSAPVTPRTIPGAPSIAGVTPGNASVSVAFAAPASDGGAPIAAYTAQCGSGSASGVDSPLVVGGLANGTPVTCTVVAGNVAGDGPPSDASAPVTPRTVPGAPTLNSATRDGTQAILAFAVPGSDGGAAIDGYAATCQPGNLGATGAASPLTVAGLDIDTEYACSVAATNAAGAGAASNALTLAARPTADLAVAVDNGTRYVLAGSDVVYTIDVANLGANAVTGARVVDDTGDDVTIVGWTCAATGGAQCPASGSGAVDFLADLPAGASLRVTLTVNAPALPETPLENHASVTVPAAVRDTNAANDTASDGPDPRGLFRGDFE